MSKFEIGDLVRYKNLNTFIIPQLTQIGIVLQIKFINNTKAYDILSNSSSLQMNKIEEYIYFVYWDTIKKKYWLQTCDLIKV